MDVSFWENGEWLDLGLRSNQPWWVPGQSHQMDAIRMKIPVLTLLGISAPMACVRGCCFGAAPLPPGPGRGCRDEKKKNVPVRQSFIFC